MSLVVAVSAVLLIAGVLLFLFPAPFFVASAAAATLSCLFAVYRTVLLRSPMPGNSSYGSRFPRTDHFPSSLGSPFSSRERRTASDLKILENDRTFAVRSPSSTAGTTRDPPGFYRSPARRDDFDSDLTVSPRNLSRRRAFLDETTLSPLTSPPASPFTTRSSFRGESYLSDDWTPSSPSMGPGCYPWLVPNSGHDQKTKVSLPSEPVKIKLHKRNASFPQPPDEKEECKEDTTLKIIGALKALSRKRLHTTESDEDANDSTNLSKRRPAEHHSSLYSSQIGFSNEPSNASLSETLEKSSGAANGIQNCSDMVNSVANAPVPQLSAAPFSSNKRPRAANDSGNQLAKKRNNEILSSLSSSIALLDQSVLRVGLKRHQKNKGSVKKPKNQETHCVEVQTLPSPITLDFKTEKKQDKGTTTDTIFGDDQNNIHQSDINTSPVVEKKVTEKMAAALLKSALKKFANSGDLVPSETSATSTSILSETSLTKSDTSISVAQIPSTSPPILSSNLFSFGKPPVTSEASVGIAVPTTGEATKTNEAAPILMFGASGGVSTALPVKPMSAAVETTSAQTNSTSQPQALQPLASLTSQHSVLTGVSTVSTTPSMFTFSSTSTPQPPKTSFVPPAVVTTVCTETATPKPTTGFSFGATSDQKPAFKFGSSTAPVTSSVANVQESTPALTSAGSQNAITTGFTFNQTPTTPQANLETQMNSQKLGSVVSTSAATQSSTVSPSKPGGFSFTPSTNFAFPLSTASATTTTVSAQPAQPIFSFGGAAAAAASKQDAGPKLFGMPPPPVPAPSTANSTPEPPKMFAPAATGGFKFGQTKDPPKLTGFPSPTPPLAIQKPEAKKQEGFVFGGTPQKAESASSLFKFGSATATSEPPKSTQSAFVFGANNPAPSFGSLTSKPSETPSGSLFGSTSTTVSNVFGSTTGSTTASAGFGATAQMPLAFKATTTTGVAFGSTSNLPPTSTMATPAFGTTQITNSAFNSSTPVFGSATGGTFGSSTPAFGSGSAFRSSSTTSFSSASSTFGSSVPTFGAAATPAPMSGTDASTPAFGAGSSTTPQFGTGTFSSLAPAPAFGSSMSPAPAFGAQRPTSPPRAPFAFSAPSAPVQSPAQAPFNFSAPNTGAPQARPLFQFGATQQAGNAPFSFSGAPSGPPAAGGFPMFSIGSGTSAPRSRAVLRTRKK